MKTGKAKLQVRVLISSRSTARSAAHVPAPAPEEHREDRGRGPARHEDYSSSQGGTYDLRYRSLQAGPRVSPGSGRVQPYIEVLIGVTRLGVWERRLDNAGEWGLRFIWVGRNSPIGQECH